MNKAVKCLRQCLLDSGLFLCLTVGLSSASAEELGVLPHHLISKDSADACSVVKVHSLSTAPDGTTLHQQGQGWVTMLRRRDSASELGVVTPYHVVVNAQSVYAECKGKLIPLLNPVVDAERDITYFGIADWDLVNKTLTPILIEVASEQIRNAVYPTKAERQIHAQRMTPKEIQAQLPEVLNSMTNFGVAMSPEKDLVSSVMLSPNANDIVNAAVDRTQAGVGQLIRVENFGIRPGISGAVLFGVPESIYSSAYNVALKRRVYGAPLEVMPKFVLGMIIKTKLNGAETVALSLPDITSFLERHVMQGAQVLPSTLEVHYHTIPSTAGGAQLQSYLSLGIDDSSVVVQEVCSSEFKNSADFKLIVDKNLMKRIEESKRSEPPHDKKLENQLNDLKHRQKPDNRIIFDIKNLEKLQKKSGGGEYGEGGDGFLTPEAQFLTSKNVIGSFDNEELNYKALGSAHSFGLYLQNRSCQQQGLLIDGQAINAVAIPGEPLERLVTYEDLRRFAKKYPAKTAVLLKKFGTNEKLPFFTFEKSWQENLKIPLARAQAISSADPDWQPLGRSYFKERLTAAFESDSYVELGKDKILLNTRITGVSQNLEKLGWIQLLYDKASWSGRFALNSECQIMLKPSSFKAIHPWLVEYNDGANELKIEIGTMNRLLSISFQKVECTNMKDLALGEVEIYSNGAMSPIAGVRRNVFVALPVDFEFIKKAFANQQRQSVEKKNEK